MRYLTSSFAEVEIQRDIPFAEVTNNQGELERLKLDVYYPKGDQAAQRPAILWIHGGGFKPGRDKGQNYIVDFASRFAHKGYVCIAPDYRVRENPWDEPRGTISDAVSDVSQALHWVRNQTATYGIDENKLIIAGGSAGGMIAVNLCYGDGTFGARPDLSGVVAMLNLWGSPSVLCLDVHEQSMPSVTIHGTVDALVNIENSRRLIHQLRDAGVKHVFIPLEGAPHTPLSHMEQMDAELSLFLADVLSETNRLK